MPTATTRPGAMAATLQILQARAYQRWWRWRARTPPQSSSGIWHQVSVFAAPPPGRVLTRCTSRPALPSAECAVRLGAPPAAEGAERAGMLMVLKLHAAPSGALYALGGYEDGWYASVLQQYMTQC